MINTPHRHFHLQPNTSIDKASHLKKKSVTSLVTKHNAQIDKDLAEKHYSFKVKILRKKTRLKRTAMLLLG
jgi:hypothetical protein